MAEQFVSIGHQTIQIKPGFNDALLELSGQREEAHSTVSTGMCRTNSCASILWQDDERESHDAFPLGSGPGCWGDIEDSDDEDWVKSPLMYSYIQSSAGASRSHSASVSADAEEKTSAPSEAGLDQTSSGRTPLRCNASLFVPCSSRVSNMCTQGLCSFEHVGAHRCFTAPGTLPSRSTDDQNTTVMMRNLPCPLLRDDLIDAMDKHGFAGCYNIVFLPRDYNTGMGLGYAFVDLSSREEADRFTLAFEGFCDWPKPSSKVCSVVWSRTQGLSANIARYRNNPVMSEGFPDSFKPVLFAGNVRVPFPGPTWLPTEPTAQHTAACVPGPWPAARRSP